MVKKEKKTLLNIPSSLMPLFSIFLFFVFCQRQNFLSLTMIQPPVVSSVVVVVVVVGVVGVSVQIKNGITF